MAEPRRCKAKSSRSGKQCRKRPILGGVVCATHGGAAPQVKRAAAERVRDMLEEAIDPDRSLREAARVAFSDIRLLFDDQGRLLPVKQWPEDIARAVAGVEVVKRNVYSDDGKIDDVIKVKLWDKGRKLENLMKYHGQLTEKVELSGGSELLALLHEGRARVAKARMGKA